MQIHPMLWALALSALSVVAAQNSTGNVGSGAGQSSTENVGTGFVTATITSTGSAVAATAWATSVPMANSGVEVDHGGKGANIAAAVGGSVAACLIILAGVLFFIRRSRARRTLVVTLDSAAETRRRCTDLESQVHALREQVDRLEAQQLTASYGVGALYTHEKDPAALGKVAGGEMKQEAPPTYVG
ncbi:hypothetical protein FB451DRAFT_1228524 [Mycena latifolia]|nr:hypothetical protein FB451DRAFT_1228524 [Mycena latifolia]